MEMTKPVNPPAFPRICQKEQAHCDRILNTYGGYSGLSMLDYFAGRAMQGIISHPRFDDGRNSPDDVASLAYGMAEAMLMEREMRILEENADVLEKTPGRET